MYSIYVYYTYRYTRYTGSRPLSRPAISRGQIYCYIAGGFELFGRGHGHLATLKMVTYESAQFVVQMMQTKTGAQSLRSA